ncbi:MAG TPA: S9 family peptidase [Chloroflexota bacterium]|nr:S9 family peptidase [Chloroflexota bacterium]
MGRLTPDALVYDTVSAGDPQVSPDGSRLVYVVGRASREADAGTSQVWLADIDGGNARQLTWAGERNREPRWSPDGRSIAFVAADRLKGSSGLFVLPIDQPGEARELARQRRAIGHLAWSPDGRSIAYTVEVDPVNVDEQPAPDGHPPKVKVTRRLDYKQENRGWVNDTRRQVVVVDTQTSQRRTLTHESNDVLYPQWSPDGQTLAARIPLASGIFSQLALIDASTGAVRWIGPARGAVGVWAWSPRSDRILFGGDTEPTPGADLFVYDVQQDAIRRLTTDLPVAPDTGFPTVLPPSQPVWLNEAEVLLHASRAGESGLYRFNVQTGDLQLEHAGRSMNAGLSVDRERRYVAQTGSTLESLGEIMVFDRQTGHARTVTDNNATLLRAAPPASWERFDVERDGTVVEAWLLKPADFDPAKKYPVILDVHGGPHGFYGYGFNNMQQLLASNGFVVVFSNPRGSGSYGRDFAEMVRCDWGGEDYLDLMAVLDAALERPFVDATRTGIWGYSYGGYMTAWAIGQSDRFQAAVCGAPCFDLESMYGTSDISHAWGPLQWGGAPHEASEAFAAHSPSTFAHRTKTPTLIMQGEADERCPIGQGEQMFVALSQAGCEVEFARYPGGAHAMLRVGPPSHRADFLTRLLGWFSDHLGGPRP